MSKLYDIAPWVARVALVFVAGWPLAARAEDPSPTLLRWNFQKGDVHRYEYRQKTETKAKGAAQEVAHTVELAIDMTWKVAAVDMSEAAEVVMTVERVKATIRNGPQTLQFDSKDDSKKADPATEALSLVYRAAIGPEYLLRVSRRGKIVSAKVPAAVTEALRGSPFLAVADGGSIFSERGVQNLFAQVFPTFPEEKVAPGGGWTETLELPSSPLLVTLKSAHTLKSAEGSAVKIEAALETAIRPAPDVACEVEQGKQSGLATFAFDTRAGRLTEASVRQSLALTLRFMKNEVEQTINIEIGMKRVP
jgi:hypothetical protein